MQMNCCTGNLHPLLEGEGGRMESFGRKHLWGAFLEKNSIISSFLELPKLWELWVSSPARSVGGDLPESWKSGKFSHPRKNGSHGPKPEVVRGNIREKGFFILIFAPQKMKPPFWVGLTRNWVREAQRTTEAQCASLGWAGCRRNVVLVTLSCLEATFGAKKPH